MGNPMRKYPSGTALKPTWCVNKLSYLTLKKAVAFCPADADAAAAAAAAVAAAAAAAAAAAPLIFLYNVCQG